MICVVESCNVPVVPQVSIFVLYIDGCANYIASLYNSGVGALQVGIRAGLPVGNPFFWSMSSLVKIIYNLTMSCENLLRILLLLIQLALL